MTYTSGGNDCLQKVVAANLLLKDAPALKLSIPRTKQSLFYFVSKLYFSFMEDQTVWSPFYCARRRFWQVTQWNVVSPCTVQAYICAAGEIWDSDSPTKGVKKMKILLQ
jgi:hypothetical protein